MAVHRGKYRQSRPYDYIYDSSYVVSGPKDFQRCVNEAAKMETELQPLPNFDYMFSDHPKYPRLSWKLKCSDKLPPHLFKSFSARQIALAVSARKKIDVNGTERHLFFRRALVYKPCYKTTAVYDENAEEHDTSSSEKCTRGVQTVYRDSETQTTPWAPPYFTKCEDPVPEILSLAMLSWGCGLPAGVHEVEIIERLRIKRAWERCLPPLDTAANIDKRRDIVEALERDEWSFREEEIQTIHEMRLELANHLLEDNQNIMSSRLCERLERLRKVKEAEKEIKLNKIRLKTNRALRKLTLQHKGVNMKYHKQNVIEEHIDKTSELYGPLMRHGENPKRRHEVINIHSRFLSQVKGLEILERMPRWIPSFDFVKASVPRSRHRELCIRETRWTEEVLEKLHRDLRAIRMKKKSEDEFNPFSLITRIPQPKTHDVAPEEDGDRDAEENLYQAVVLLQSVIKGRAIQTMMNEGRQKYQELIEDYKRTKALYSAEIPAVMKDRLEIKMLQREKAIAEDQDMKWLEVCSYLEGLTVSGIMDFLSKETTRLQDERKAHAFALLAERERTLREAAEAGRRQAEERRRREHDEAFKQVVKVHQDTVDMYLEDIILESMDWVNKESALQYIREVAKMMDHAAEEARIRSSIIAQEELVGSLVHDFVVPEAEKIQVRKKIKMQQEKYLRTAHAAIYDYDIPAPEAEKCVEDVMASIELDVMSRIGPRKGGLQDSDQEVAGHPSVEDIGCPHCKKNDETIKDAHDGSNN